MGQKSDKQAIFCCSKTHWFGSSGVVAKQGMMSPICRGHERTIGTMSKAQVKSSDLKKELFFFFLEIAREATINLLFLWNIPNTIHLRCIDCTVRRQHVGGTTALRHFTDCNASQMDCQSVFSTNASKISKQKAKALLQQYKVMDK